MPKQWRKTNPHAESTEALFWLGDILFEATPMRTTLNIDDDVLAAAKKIAATERKNVGTVISALARQALRPVPSSRTTRNGIALLPVRAGASIVTSELVRQLQEELQ
jgi:hypothetical protein